MNYSHHSSEDIEMSTTPDRELMPPGAFTLPSDFGDISSQPQARKRHFDEGMNQLAILNIPNSDINRYFHAPFGRPTL